ncbi:hypothetical protein [Alloalcanivorax xenomutans]
MSRYRPIITLSQPELAKLRTGKRPSTVIQRGQWLRLPTGERGRYVRHDRRGGLWMALGDSRPYSVNIEFASLVSKARLLEPHRNQLSLV